jgi:hypothetical protein
MLLKYLAVMALSIAAFTCVVEQLTNATPKQILQPDERADWASFPPVKIHCIETRCSCNPHFSRTYLGCLFNPGNPHIQTTDLKWHSILFQDTIGLDGNTYCNGFDNYEPKNVIVGYSEWCCVG